MLDSTWLTLIFGKLTVTYPGRFPPVGNIDLIRDEWARGLANISADDLKHALANLPERYAPTVSEFLALAHSRPRVAAVLGGLEGFKADPAKARAARELAETLQGRSGPRDPLQWARRLRDREAKGENLTPWQKAAWRDALWREMPMPEAE